MERQLLHLLDWDLHFTEEDLYRELDPFLAPLRFDVAVRHEQYFRLLMATNWAKPASQVRLRG
jgi:hypothetical protein